MLCDRALLWKHQKFWPNGEKVVTLQSNSQKKIEENWAQATQAKYTLVYIHVCVRKTDDRQGSTDIMEALHGDFPQQR
jgi:hypothetical protein